jgi:uncharacterized membrane protein
MLLLSAILLLILDSIFLWTSKSLFKTQIQKVQGSPLQIYYRGAIPCYLLLIAGLNYFILYPHKSVFDAFLLGFLIYGVYETTNYSILKDWSFTTVLVDTLWGGILFSLVTWLTYNI